LCSGAGLAEKAALIEAEKANYPIVWMCEQLNVPRSSFYAWRTRVGKVSASAARREELKVEIEQIYWEHNQTYGCRRITVELNARGHAARVGLVASLMRARGLPGIQRKAYKRTPTRDEDAQVFPDLLGGAFAPAGSPPGRVWWKPAPICVPAKGGSI